MTERSALERFDLLIFIDFAGGVVALKLNLRLYMLEPATWLQKLVHLLVQFGPVINRALHIANMDEVKGLRLKGPILLCIVNLKLEVRRYPAGLRG